MKKYFALIIVIMLIIPAPVMADADNDTLFGASFAFLEQLGIVQGDDGVQDISVSRGKFIDMIVKARNIQDGAFVAGTFSDVTPDTPYAVSICTAKNNGIIQNMDGNNFLPQQAIEFKEAVMFSVSALGYGQIARVYGGYPIGYQTVASSIKLLSGIGRLESNAFLMREAVIMLYNFLNCDICMTTAVKGEDVKMQRMEGRCPLSEYFSLSNVEGIVKTAGFATMIPDYKPSYSQISIGGEVLKTDLDDAEEYLGLYTIGWYDENKRMKAIYVKSTNKTLEFDVKNVDGCVNNTLKIYDEKTQRQSSYSISKALTFVKNAKVIEHTDLDFVFDMGKIRIIDNDNDGVYDVAIAKDGEYMVISSVDKINEIVYDINISGKILNLKKQDGYHSQILLFQQDGSYKKVSINSLSNGMVLTVFSSENYTEVYGCDQSVTGLVSEKDESHVCIDGKEYKTNKYFSDNYNIVMGENVKFLIACDGTVTAVGSDSVSSMQYGYFLAYACEKKGVSVNSQISLLTVSTGVVHLNVARYVFLDGVKVSNDDISIKNTFMNDNTPKYQVIKYKLNDKNEISVIDSAQSVLQSVQLSQKYNADYLGQNSLTQFLSLNRSYWNWGAGGIFSPHAVPTSKTVMFSVPKNLITENGYVKYDEKSFSVIKTTYLGNYGTYTIDAYDMDEYMQPAVIVLYDQKAGNSTSVSDNEIPGIVEKVTQAINADGEITANLTIWQNAVYKKYFINSEEYEKLKDNGNIPCSGDIVRFNVNLFGEIIGIVTDAKYSETEKTAVITGNAPASGQVDNSYYSGKVFSHNSLVLALLIEEAAGFNPDHSDVVKDGVAPFILNGSTKIAIYDTKNKIVKQGKKEMIADALHAGSDNASRVVLKCYSHGIQALFIYE